MSNIILKEYVYEGLGFPVVLCNVPAKKVRGEWTPFINYEVLARNVLKFLCFLQEPLTGNQIFFIRQQLHFTGEKLAGLLGISQAAISKWEKRKDQIAKVEPCTEYCLRIIALEHIKKGCSEELRENLINSQMLGEIKDMQKDEDFIPSQVKLREEEIMECFQ